MLEHLEAKVQEISPAEGCHPLWRKTYFSGDKKGESKPSALNRGKSKKQGVKSL
jgi:hypothetical protein